MWCFPCVAALKKNLLVVWPINQPMNTLVEIKNFIFVLEHGLLRTIGIVHFL